MNKKTRRRLKISEKQKKDRSGSIKLLIWSLLILSIIALFIALSPSKLAPNQKIILYGRTNDNTDILILDPQNITQTNLSIPGSTQVKAAYELGSWKLQSVWALSDQEKLGSKLIKNTLIKSFNFPVQYYVPGNFNSFSSTNPLALINFISRPSSLTLKDKIKIGLLLLKIPKSSKVNIDLKDTSILTQKQLVTGDQGYIISESIPLSTAKLFSQPDFFENNIKLRLINKSNSYQAENLVNSVSEVLGSKVVSVENEQSDDKLDCEIHSQNISSSKILADLLGCNLIKQNQDGPIQIELIIGNEFYKRF
jgi:hypothetical protein